MLTSLGIHTFRVVKSDGPVKPTSLRLPVVDRKETTDSLEAKVEMISSIATDSLSHIEASLKCLEKLQCT